MSFYEQYKPFRNYLRQFAILPGLEDVWRYSLHIMEDQPLPPGYAVGKITATLQPMKDLVHPWELGAGHPREGACAERWHPRRA
jgi:hypothetical protein